MSEQSYFAVDLSSLKGGGVPLAAYPDEMGDQSLDTDASTWKVYNFEVAEHHTYIADGVRVHNKSVLANLQTGDKLLDITIDDNGLPRDMIVERDIDADGIPETVEYDGIGILGDTWLISTTTTKSDGTLETSYSVFDFLEGTTDAIGKGVQQLLSDAADRIYHYASGLLEVFDGTTVSPLVLDLDGDGIELTSLEGATAFFDLDLDGWSNATGWIGPDDGLLALDLNNNGYIDDARELFGDQTGWGNGFRALAVYDFYAHGGTFDGYIDDQDAIFSDLVIWQDKNSDGYSQSHEMQALSEAGIASIDLGYIDWSANPADDLAGNDRIKPLESTFTWSDGSAGRTLDVYFESDLLRTIKSVDNEFRYHDEVFDLPFLPGVGKLASTWIAMSEDAALRASAGSLVNKASEGEIIEFLSDFQGFLFEWADIPRAWGGDHMDGQILSFVETVLGRDFRDGDIPGHTQAGLLTGNAGPMIAALALEFLTQVAKSDAMRNSLDADAFKGHFNQHPLRSLTSTESDAAAIVSGLLAAVYDGGLELTEAGVILNLYVTAGVHSRRSILSATESAILEDGTDEAIGLDTFARVALIRSHFVFGTGLVDDINQYIEPFYRQVIFGLEGDDEITDGRTADLHIYRRGDGSDTITNQHQNTSSSPTPDTLFFADLDSNEVIFRWEPHSYGIYNLAMTTTDGAEIVSLRQYLSNTSVYSRNSIEQIAFVDGVILDLAGISAKELSDTGREIVHGTSEDDVLTGNIKGDFLFGYVGDDHILGMEGDDYIDGGEGVDTLQGGLADDKIEGGADTDSLDGGDGADELYAGVEGGGSEYSYYFGDDTLRGGAGDDLLVGANGGQLLDGGAGDDTLNGGDDRSTADTDSLYGGNGNDLLISGQVITPSSPTQSKGDQLQGGSGQDTLEGGAANDTLEGGSGTDSLDGGAGDDTLYAADALGSNFVGADTLRGGADDDRLVGANGGQELYGDAGNDTLEGGDDMGTSDMDILVGGAGNDLLRSGQDAAVSEVTQSQGDLLKGGSGDDTLEGGAANDTLEGGSDTDDLRGGAGADVLWASTATENDVGSDTLRGEEGDDILNGANGAQLLIGGAGNDTIRGGDDFTTSDQDTLRGGDGDDLLISGQGVAPSAATKANGDRLEGEKGNDTLQGGMANDTLQGGDGDDSLSGSDGNDRLFGGAGADTLDGGAGIDLVQYYVADAGMVVDLQHANLNTGHAAGDTFLSIENLHGGGGDDDLRGTSGDNVIWGGNGDDVLYGRGGNDVLSGGDGADRFVFRRDYDIDTVTDFTDGIDTLHLQNLGLTSAQDALAVAVQSGSDVRFDFGQGDVLVVRNVTKADLADDILV